MTLCPCGSKLNFENCCLPYLENKSIPETAEKLMRARYTAYVVGNIDFIQNTYLNHLEDFDYQGTQRWAQSSTWKGLTIKATEKGGANDEEGYVEFIAYYADESGKDCYHQEKSHFVKQDNKWFFKEGIFKGLSPLKRENEKIGRNDPCTCGSGKKYKKCCGA